MIFVTVGTQLAFDRLIVAVDAWAGAVGRTDVFAQIGPTAFRPANIEFEPFISPEEHRNRMGTADAIVAHAGMGTIIGALELGKPLLVMPRRAALGEHRNDHQMATVRRFGVSGTVTVCMNGTELADKLEQLGHVDAGDRIGPYASDALITAVGTFIFEDFAAL